MKFRRNLKEEVNVNLTPLIDVVFLLLIFFMVTTTFTRNTNLLIDLPEAQGQVTQTPENRIEILVARDGSYAVNGESLVNSQLETLMQAVTEVAGDNIERPLVITADAQASHQAVVTAMDAVAQLGFTRINIATRQGEGGDE